MTKTLISACLLPEGLFGKGQSCSFSVSHDHWMRQGVSV